MSAQPQTDGSLASSIRKLAYADLPAVLSIERRAFATPWSLAMFVLELSKPSGICLAASDDEGRLAGYLVCSRYSDIWHLMNVAVDPDRRRAGIASALIRALLEQLDQDPRLTLEVRTTNLGAIALYEEFGFTSKGVRPRYYQDTGDDALIMWLGEPIT